MPTVWRYLGFVDIRRYTLKFVSPSVSVRFQFVAVRWHTLLAAQYVEDFCACTKFFDVCRRAEHSFTERNSYGMFVRSTVTVGFQHGGIRQTNFWSNRDELRTYK